MIYVVSNELQLKKGFKPHIIFVDYLNICCSARIKPGGNVNSYSYLPYTGLPPVNVSHDVYAQANLPLANSVPQSPAANYSGYPQEYYTTVCSLFYYPYSSGI